MNYYPTLGYVKRYVIYTFFALVFFFGYTATAQNTVSGTVYHDADGSARGTFTNILTGAETGTNGNGSLRVYVVTLLDIIVATSVVANNGTYTSSSYSALLTPAVYLVLDTVSRNVGDDISLFSSIKMPAAWTNTSPFMTGTILNLGGNLINQDFGIQKNGFLTIPDFSVCNGTDSLFTWYFRGGHTNLITGITVVENSGISAKLPFFKVTARYFTNNDTYSTVPDIYSPSTYTIAGSGGLQPIPLALAYHNPVLEAGGSSLFNGVTTDSVGISIAFKNTNGQKMYIQKLNNAVLDLDTYESLKVIGYNNGTEVKPVIYVSNGYADNTTNDMRSFYIGNKAWIFGVSSGFQSQDPCNAWCDYNYNSVAIIEFPTAVDSVFYTARITEPTGNRDYLAGSLGSNEVTGFNYCPVSIQGNLWNDANGNGIKDNSEMNVLNNGYYINMLDEYGKVLATTQIQADGTYRFSDFPQLATTVPMKLQLSVTQGIIGSIPPPPSVPAGYIIVSENRSGIPETGNLADMEINMPLLLSSNLVNFDFGIERLPIADPVSQAVLIPSGRNISAGTITVSISGTDAEDGPLDNNNTIVIAQLPANATLYYGGTPVVLYQQITNFNPGLLSYSGITNGSMSVVFQYAFLDAASKQGLPANFTVYWVVALPINLESFTAVANDCNTVSLNWKVSDGIKFSHFEIERSTDGIDFASLGMVLYNPAVNNYHFSEYVMERGAYQYRLKLVDIDGKEKYSPLSFIRLDCNEQRAILIYPNPAKNYLTINGLSGGEEISIYNAAGQVINIKKASGYQLNVDITNLADGVYHIVITNKQGIKVSKTKFAKTN